MLPLTNYSKNNVTFNKPTNANYAKDSLKTCLVYFVFICISM